MRGVISDSVMKARINVGLEWNGGEMLDGTASKR